MTRLFWFTTFQDYQIWFKSTRGWLKNSHVWTRFYSIWSQVHISLNYQDMEVVLVAMSSHFHPQQLLFIKHLYWYKKVVQNFQVSSKHFLDLGSRVLNFKEVHLSHLLVFLSDSKDIILFKGLSTNNFKSYKEFSCGRNLVKKKDYKSSKWIPNFPYVTSNGHNMVNCYHFEPILFPWWS